MTEREVVIIGAGVAGLALGRALALRGFQVTLLEQAETVREFGAGLQITPNGLQVLRGLGLDSRLQGIPAQSVVLNDGPSGRRVAELALARLRPDQSWRFVHRGDLIALLEAGAREAGVEIRLLQRIERLTLSPEGPVLTTAQGAEMRAPLVIGADGLHSVGRGALNQGSHPFFTGQVAWRATIPGVPGDAAVAEIHMGPGRHLVSYPLRGGQLRNLVAVEEREAWSAEGWSHPDDPEEMRRGFRSFSPRVRDWLDQVDRCWLWGLYRHPIAACWGRVARDAPTRGLAILGDAAHPTLPFLAQGANMALEDAWVLAECLAGEPDLATALGLYQSRRAPRVNRVVDAASANARNYHLRSPLREVAHLGLQTLSRFAPGQLVGRYDWIHGHDVTRP